MYIICYPFNSQLLDFVNLLAQTSEHDHLPEHWHHKNGLDAENATTVEPFKWGMAFRPQHSMMRSLCQTLFLLQAARRR